MPGSPSPDAADKAGEADLAKTGESHNAAFLKHISDYLEKNALTPKASESGQKMKEKLQTKDDVLPMLNETGGPAWSLPGIPDPATRRYSKAK